MRSAPVDGTPAPSPQVHAALTHRRDVVSVRSRMRTKYGFQRQIDELAAALTDDETLLLLAAADTVVSEARTVGKHVHGLLGLTDQRFLFVPKAPAPLPVPVSVMLAEVRSVVSTPDGRHGTLSVLLTDGPTTTFGRLTGGDRRDICVTIGRLHPAVQHVSPC